jgi:predicted metalloprotease with PDZ domain
MKTHYIVQIDTPEQHHVKVTLKFTRPKGAQTLKVFMPSWSPGSYFMREYARNVRWFEASQSNGEILYYEQKAKGIWEIDWKKSALKSELDELQVSYEIYCKELTVRTSHVDASHAFLHGPSYLMGIMGESLENPTIEFRFPALWSKLSTSLKDISDGGKTFIYTAKNYDELIDSPVEIGCQVTDGFMYQGKPHHLAYYGEQYPHKENLKEDIKKITEAVAKHFKEELPYDQYLYLTHFVPKLFGGLEHLSSTALQFDGRKLSNRKDYLNYLALVAHEYFHLWNVKRIRPQELGPFDYLNENYSSMLWLAEGLTSFMDDLFVYRAGISTLEEYLEAVRSNLDNYLTTPGRNYHSLEQSSFNAWVKLYRPDENSKNSTVSYYLKGGLVFTVLHSLLMQKGKSINDLITALWEDFQSRPEKGISREGVYEIVKKLGGEEILLTFSNMIETTEEIDFESAFKSMGCALKWQELNQPWVGLDWDFSGDRALVKTVVQDGPAHHAGLNAGDEIIFVNGLRFLKEDADNFVSLMMIDQPYEYIISRFGKLERIEVTPTKSPRSLKTIAVTNREVAEKTFKF